MHNDRHSGRLYYIAHDHKLYKNKIDGQLRAIRRRQIETFLITYDEDRGSYIFGRVPDGTGEEIHCGDRPENGERKDNEKVNDSIPEVLYEVRHKRSRTFFRKFAADILGGKLSHDTGHDDQEGFNAGRRNGCDQGIAVTARSEDENFQIIYIRRIGLSVILWKKLLCSLKKPYSERPSETPGNGAFTEATCKIVYELPTFPITESASVLRRALENVEDHYIRHVVSGYVDCFPACCYTDGSTREADNAGSGSDAFQSKFLKCSNCVDPDRYAWAASRPLPDYDKSELRILGIAHCRSWHAYDRLLRAMASWKGATRICFTLYGDRTAESLRLEELSVKLGIGELVHFITEADMEELSVSYHMAAGTLGTHRRNRGLPGDRILDTSIKNKEYCAMGIPFFHSGRDEAFDDSLIFHHRVSQDDGDIDLTGLTEWYGVVYDRLKDRSIMISYAAEHLTFDIWAEGLFQRLG